VGFLDLTRAEHAYLFGFLQCDGSFKAGPGRKGALTVELAARDRQLLEEFQRIVPFYTSIRTRTRRTNFSNEHTSVIWTLHALAAREDLTKLGLPTGRKSKILEPPSVPFSQADYLRGLVDADGSVGFMTHRFVPFVSLTTSSAALKDFFIASCPSVTGAPRERRRNERDGVFNLLVMREAAVRLSQQMYYEGCLAIPRKVDAARRVKRWVRPPDMRVAAERRAWTPAEDDLVLRTAISDAARILGRTEQSVNLRRWRLGTAVRIRARTSALSELKPPTIPCS
jgi:LAGLIDADG-like domain